MVRGGADPRRGGGGLSGVVDTPPGVRIVESASTAEPVGEGGRRERDRASPALAPLPVVDRLLRLYAYTVRYLETLGPLETVGRSGRRYGRGTSGVYLNAVSLYRGIGRHGEHYPGIFRAYLDYPRAFEEVAAEPLENFLLHLPASVSVWDLDRAVERLTGVEFPPLMGVTSAPRRRWRVLELPGSMGRYSSLLCRAYSELEPATNCTMLAVDPFGSATGALEAAVTNVNALLAVGHIVSAVDDPFCQQDTLGKAARPAQAEVVRSYEPGILEEAHDPEGFLPGYDLIVGSRSDVGGEPGGRGRAMPDRDALRRSLAPGGDLVLLDVPSVRLGEASATAEAQREGV